MPRETTAHQDRRLLRALKMCTLRAIARFRDWRFGENIRIEHWRTAEQQGRDAALNMPGNLLQT